MVLQCGQCNLFFRTEDKLNNHKEGLMGLKCEVSDVDTENGIKGSEMNVAIEPNEEQNRDQAEQSLSGSTIVNEAQDTETSDANESFAKINPKDDVSNSPSNNTNDDVNNFSLQVQNNEVTSTKEPNVNEDVDKSPVDDSIMISDAESSEEETEADISSKVEENQLDDYYDSTEADSETKLPKPDLDYTLVCVHIETFRVSNDPSISLTQIGCTTALNITRQKETFFQPIKPAGLEHFLDNFKMEGDLLKALHMTDENGKFEFRAQFEIKRKEKNKVYCTSEKEALEKLSRYLEKFSNVILFAVDEDTLEVILGKLAQLRPEKDLPVAGFTTWPKVLEHCLQYAGRRIYDEESDLEDFYSRHCGQVAGYITALDVANFLRKSIKKLCSDYAGKSRAVEPEKKFNRNKFIDDIVEDVKNIKTNTAGKVEANKPFTVEVFSSFRPAVSTTIGIEKMDTIELSSGEESEDSDIDIVAENLKPKNYTKRKSIDDSELISAKRKHPFDFPEYPVSKRPNFSEDPIVISSDEEDDEITLDEEVAPRAFDFSIARGLGDVQEMLKRNYTQLSLTKTNEGSWLGKSNLASNPKCCICQIEFEDSQDLESHTEREHLYCKVCNLYFDVLSDAIFHVKLHEVSQSMAEFSDEENLAKDLDNTCKPFQNTEDYDFHSTTKMMDPTVSNLNIDSTPVHS